MDVTGSGGMVRPVAQVLADYQGAAPDALAAALRPAVTDLGGDKVVLYLIDYGHTTLMPYPDVLLDGEPVPPAGLDGTMAGRAFTSGRPLAVERQDGWQAWVPVVERANRLGVLALRLPWWNPTVERYCLDLGLAAAHLVTSAAGYTDLPHLLRRRKDLDLAAELQWSLLPPPQFTVAGTSLTGLLEPAYQVAGDCFDYAFNAGILDLAIFDPVGHGLTSSTLAGLVVGAYRHGRRAGLELAELAAAIDTATGQFPGLAFATAVLARLDVCSGALDWLTCGHPQPITSRGGATLDEVAVRPCLPLGLGDLAPTRGEVITLQLEPGDGVLFYTDGVVEARDQAGGLFGETALRDLLAREHHTGGPPTEIVRRLVRSTLQHAAAPLTDDATLLYLRWNP